MLGWTAQAAAQQARCVPVPGRRGGVDVVLDRSALAGAIVDLIVPTSDGAAIGLALPRRGGKRRPLSDQELWRRAREHGARTAAAVMPLVCAGSVRLSGTRR